MLRIYKVINDQGGRLVLKLWRAALLAGCWCNYDHGFSILGASSWDPRLLAVILRGSAVHGPSWYWFFNFSLVASGNLLSAEKRRQISRELHETIHVNLLADLAAPFSPREVECGECPQWNYQKQSRVISSRDSADYTTTLISYYFSISRETYVDVWRLLTNSTNKQYNQSISVRSTNK